MMSTRLATALDVVRIRQDFPIITRSARGKPLVYLDNAATSQKPLPVLKALDTFWTEENANVHRGVHYLSQLATAKYDAARETVRRFLNAASADEIVFTKGCTEAINLVATCLTRAVGNAGYHAGQNGAIPGLRQGDEILVSTLEHHSNIVPWQIAAEQSGATIRVIPINDAGEILLEEYEKMLSERVKVVAVGHVSNAIGTINPVKEMIASAHKVGALVVIDGAQAGPHLTVDVQDLDADFYTLSCHKVFAPTGVGVLYGKKHLLEALPPYQGGGDMIRSVSFEKTIYAEPPAKFEAGTPNVAGVIGLGAALEYVMGLGRSEIAAYEHDLLEYATEQVQSVPGLKLVGTAKHKASIVSFVMDDVHAHDIGTIVDHEGVAIRAGHHCAQPLMERFGLTATARASLSFYNTREEIDVLVRALHKVREVMS
ncbi:MAG: cysteine desulfurase [Fimbriimonadaceae bacterium]